MQDPSLVLLSGRDYERIGPGKVRSHWQYPVMKTDSSIRLSQSPPFTALTGSGRERGMACTVFVTMYVR